MISYCVFKTAWGPFAFVARGLTILDTYLPGSTQAQLQSLVAAKFPDSTFDAELLPDFQDDVKRYFAGEQVSFRVQLDWSGCTAFQRAVLKACRRIGYGRTRSYGELAAASGSPRAARAVGSVMANNRLPLIIPCHRVVAGGGRLGGFSSAQGVDQKAALLELEGVGAEAIAL